MTDSPATSGLLGGKRALLTDATRGIGNGISEVPGEAGASVVITGRDSERGEAVVAELVSRGGECHYPLADVRSTPEFARAAEYVETSFDGLDLPETPE